MSNPRFGAGNAQNDPRTSCHTRKQGIKKKKKARKLLRMGKKDLGAKSQMSKLKTVRDWKI